MNLVDIPDHNLVELSQPSLFDIILVIPYILFIVYIVRIQVGNKQGRSEGGRWIPWPLKGHLPPPPRASNQKVFDQNCV